ncbi:YdbL family protein [Desulfococcaceae bacterium HSG7]|nr:YdbL family protein [Desulfococcaceae bacterium HSG7]
MQKRHFLKISASFVFILFFMATFVQGADIKSRMQARLPQIIKLKTQGIIGENSQGLLEFRSANKNGANIVNAENADRQKIYKAIAKQQGVDVTLVSQKRAQQIRAKAGAGEWLQKPDGQWYKK